jgi:hypothetical protein
MPAMCTVVYDEGFTQQQIHKNEFTYVTVISEAVRGFCGDT